MPEHIQYEDNDLFNPETHHEHSDVPVSPLIKAIVIFIIGSVVTYFFVKFLYDQFSSMETHRMDPPQTQVARPADAAVPKNQPLLQPFPRKGIVPNMQTPVVDLIEMRKAEDLVLHNYGWVDKEHGVVHIPIDDAKRMLLERGLVTAATPAATPVPAAGAAPPAPTAGGPQTAPPSAEGQRPAAVSAVTSTGGAH
jgi:hypothetical protein